MLLEAPLDPSRLQKNSVLLAIDLTTAVADEAIKNKNSVVVAYRMAYPISPKTGPLLRISETNSIPNTTQTQSSSAASSPSPSPIPSRNPSSA